MFVMPAQTGIQVVFCLPLEPAWIPAGAGMTESRVNID